MTHAICFLTNKLSNEYFQFCKSIYNPFYKFYICVDKHSDYKSTDKIEIIDIDKNICEEAGFKGCVTYFPENHACSRDKALYYFCRIITIHSKIWFIEDDVFFYSLQTIKAIDDHYPHADLLSNNNNIKTNRKLDWQNKWHWPRIFKQSKLPPPYGTSMICAIRVSKKLLAHIDRYVRVSKTLFVDEALFNTISLQANLVTKTPTELSTIMFRKNWTNDEINKTNLYHPIKQFYRQTLLRKLLANENGQTS
jgi:hypothetical protein